MRSMGDRCASILPPSESGTFDLARLAGNTRAPVITERGFASPVSVCLERATLTVLSGENAGEVFALESDALVVGRAPDCAIWLHDANVSREHARIVREPDGMFFLEDLGSRNGVFIGGRKVTRAPLRPGDQIHVGTTIALRFDMMGDVDRALQRALYEASRRDALTQAYTRAYLLERLAREVATARRTQTEVALLRLEIDDLARICDVYGEHATDAVLCAIACALTSNVRGEDVVARWDGDAFALLTRPVTADNARWLADRVRKSIEARPIVLGSRSIRVTISIGIACYSEIRPSGAGLHELVALADARAIVARDEGRNRIVFT